MRRQHPPLDSQSEERPADAQKPGQKNRVEKMNCKRHSATLLPGRITRQRTHRDTARSSKRCNLKLPANHANHANCRADFQNFPRSRFPFASIRVIRGQSFSWPETSTPRGQPRLGKCPVAPTANTPSFIFLTKFSDHPPVAFVAFEPAKVRAAPPVFLA